MKSKLLLMSAGAFTLTACVNVSATRLSGGPALAPLAASEVTIYRSRDQVPGRFREIALLEADGDGASTRERDFNESMRKKAAKLGANGLILERGLEPGPTVKIAAALLDVQYTRYRHAIAVLVDQPSGTIVDNKTP